ncbi:MAG: hypothetical protein LBQ75_08725 [Zoogloeaceae bacterium]|jgi:hypothetical protein|nr:hypothetical protein [Zoogloeaceae bacterium]
MSITALRFQGQGHSFEIGASIEEEISRQVLGDVSAYVYVSVSSNGFIGHNDLWLAHEEIAQFARQLGELNQSLKGEAKLSSISPNELELVVRAVSSRGNVAVTGNTGYWVKSENAMFWHSVSFGFEFEPGQLSEALQGSWLRQYVSNPD